MKLKLSEDPKEWRKTAILSSIGLAILSSLLRWRHVLPPPVWIGVLLLLGAVIVTAVARPRWFRGWYRVSGWIAFQIGQIIGRVAFALAFVLIITPAGLVMRLTKRDPLHLKRDAGAASYWTKSKETTPLDRMF